MSQTSQDGAGNTSRHPIGKRLQLRIWRAVTDWDQWSYDHLPEKVWASPVADATVLMKPVCFLLGHEPIADNCGIPDHDYCVYCAARTPGQAERVAS